MKNSSFLLLLSLSLSALAQVERPCMEFDQEKSQAQLQVRDFDKEVQKLQAKLQNVEDRLSIRMQTLNSLLAQKDSLKQDLASLVNEQNALINEVNRLQNDRAVLTRAIDQKEKERQRHENAASTTSGQARREHLHQVKLLEKEIERLKLQLNEINPKISVASNRLTKIDQLISNKSQDLVSVNRQIEQEQRDTAITRLQQERSELENELNDSRITLRRLNEKLDKAESHVTMCYGYLELSVKYPSALKVSRRVYNKTCQGYNIQDLGSELENEAQDEVVASMCSRQ